MLTTGEIERARLREPELSVTGSCRTEAVGECRTLARSRVELGEPGVTKESFPLCAGGRSEEVDAC